MTIKMFPAVPAKQRIPSKLTVVLYQKAGVTDVDLKIKGISIANGLASITAEVATDVSDKFTIGKTVFIHGTNMDSVDGLHQVSVAGSWLDPDLTFTIDTGDAALTATPDVPEAAGAIAYEDFTPTSQVTEFSSNVTSTTDTWSTIGTDASEEPGETTRPISATALLRDGMDQLGPMLGTDPAKLEIEKTSLRSDKIHFLSTNWDSRDALTAQMQNYLVVAGCVWNDWRNAGSTGGWTEWSLTGSADDVYAKAVSQI